jgi:hypothetical protein
MSEDDAAYHKSVRNMGVVIGVVVLVIFASLALTYYFDIPQNTFQTKTSIPTAYPFTLTLATNSTSIPAGGTVEISAWLNGTSTGNVTSASLWALNQSRLVTYPCRSGFPVGIGIMQGHYTSDNYSLGTLAPIALSPYCPIPAASGSPPWFYFSSETPKVLVTVGGTPEFWVISTDITFGPSIHTGLGPLSPGVYTAVAADEWGDFVMSNFRVS